MVSIDTRVNSGARALSTGASVARGKVFVGWGCILLEGVGGGGSLVAFYV